MNYSEEDQRQAFLVAIIDSSDDAIIGKDLNGIIQSWNSAAEKIFGYGPDETIGKHISLLIPKDRLAEEEMIISQLKAGKRVDHYETVRRRKDGKELNISLTVSPILNDNGTVIGASKIARDITRQKEAEESIKKYTWQLEMLINTAKAISAEQDVKTILQYVTDVTTKLCGAEFGAFFYNRVDANGEAYLLYTLSGAPREHFEKFGMPRNTEVFKMTFEGKGILRSEDITKDPRYGKNSPHAGMPKGHLPVVSYLAIPVFSPTGTVLGGLFYGHPKPAMFKAEHEVLVEAIASQSAIALEKARLFEEVQALNQKKDEFIGFASHELKTPLTTMKGYVQLAEANPQMAASLLPRMNKQVDRLNAIISDLLDITKIQAGMLDFHFGETLLSTMIREAVETVSQISPDHSIKIELPEEDIRLSVDVQKIVQVLVNLLTNAIKYSPGKNNILVKACLLGDEIEISIQDFGIGISPEFLEDIFTRFYRIKKKDYSAQGMGLGLYIAREIMHGHNGKIWAQSEVGKGSTFFLSLPIKKRS